MVIVEKSIVGVVVAVNVLSIRTYKLIKLRSFLSLVFNIFSYEYLYHSLICIFQCLLYNNRSIIFMFAGTLVIQQSSSSGFNSISTTLSAD